MQQHSSTTNVINRLEITKLHPVSVIFNKLVKCTGLAQLSDSHCGYAYTRVNNEQKSHRDVIDIFIGRINVKNIPVTCCRCRVVDHWNIDDRWLRAFDCRP